MEEASVSSLRTTKDSGLTIRQVPTGGEAATGDLLLDYKLALQDNPEVTYNSRVIRSIEDRTINYAHNVSGFRINSKQLQILEAELQPDGFYSGKITLADSSGTVGQELAFEAVHLNGVEEAVERDTVGLAFPHNRPSSMLARISIPFDSSFPTFDASLVFGILIPQPGSIAANMFNLTYKIIPNPTNSAGKTVYNTAKAAFSNYAENLTCNFSCSATTASYYLVETPQFRVNQGDVVMVKIERPTANGYANRIIFLRKAAKLAAPNS
jgi:hypothetical protein